MASSVANIGFDTAETGLPKDTYSPPSIKTAVLVYHHQPIDFTITNNEPMPNCLKTTNVEHR